MGSYPPRRSERSYRRGDRITDLILRGGDIEAEGALRSGGVWGNTLGSLGQVASSAIEQDAARKAMEQKLALDEFRYVEQAKREMSRDAREEGRYAREAAKAAQEGADKKALGAATSQATAQPGAGRPPIDFDAIEATLPDHLKGQFREDVTKANESAMKFRQGQNDYLARLALGVSRHLDDPEKAAGALEIALAHAEENGIQRVNEFRERVKADPTALPQIVMEMIDRSPSAAQEYRAREPKKHAVTVAGPGGGPMAKLVTEDELAKGVSTYREPRAAPAPVRIETVENGKKVTKFVTPTAGASYPTAEDTDKPLSGEAAKVYSVATTVIPEIGQLKQAFEKDYGGSVRGVVSGTDRRLVRLVDQIADKVGRLRSGGAINKDEEERFKRQLGTTVMDAAFGKPEDAIAALDAVISEANSIVSNVRPGAPRGPLRLGQPAPPLGRFERAGGKPSGSGRYERVD